VAVPALVRREGILALLREQNFVRVADLSSLFGVSAVTIRSDLDALSRDGKIARFRGGAAAGSVATHEHPFEVTAKRCADEKAKIGMHAMTLLTSGRSLILDVGTTTTAVARALLAREDLTDLQVFTNALNIALELEPAVPRLNVVVLGGTLRPQHSLVDPFGALELDKLSADFVFLGCNGIDVDAGVTNVNAPETDIKRRMMQSARKRVVVADGSKVGVEELVRLCGVDQVDLLITSDSADAGAVAELRASGLDVEVAG
jgi:DeoR family transcriptional regulator of aga operon